MALLTPILNQVPAIDAATDYPFTFDVPSGGDAVEGSKLYISYDGEQTAYFSNNPRYENILPADTLTNGYEYTAYLTTISGLNESSPSNTITFYALPTPSFSLGNVSTTSISEINTSNFSPTILYSQTETEGVTDPLKEFTISLYNLNRQELATSGIVPTNSTTVPYSGEYQFIGLENGKNYLIRAVGKTQSGVELSTVYGEIHVEYDYPDIVFNVENKCDEGRVYYKIETDIFENFTVYDSIRIKRKRDVDYEWIILNEFALSDLGEEGDWEYPILEGNELFNFQNFSIIQEGNKLIIDLPQTGISFDGYDNLAASGVEYSYAWVPVINGVEGNYYNISILSKFDGVFICDHDIAYKFPVGVTYGTSNQIQNVGVFSPLNRKYPIYISNSIANYQTGTFSGMIVGRYLDTRVFNRKETVNQKDALLQFLTNKRGKVLKDFNGNIWLIFVVDNPSVAYKNSWGNGIMAISFNYSEIGDANSIEDLREAFLL